MDELIYQPTFEELFPLNATEIINRKKDSTMVYVLLAGGIIIGAIAAFAYIELKKNQKKHSIYGGY